MNSKQRHVLFTSAVLFACVFLVVSGFVFGNDGDKNKNNNNNKDDDQEQRETLTSKPVREAAESGDFLITDEEDQIGTAEQSRIPNGSKDKTSVASREHDQVPDKGRESRGLVVMDRAADVSVSHPDVIRLSRYLQTCPRCMVRWDSMALCPLNHVGLEMTTWLQELRELLSMGCKMSYIGGACTADKSRCCVGEDETVLDHLLDLNVRIREVYRVLQTSCDRCPVDCGWSDWSDWSTCSVRCGAGNRQRTRTPDNPSASYGGKDCEGRSRQQDPCFEPCCVDGSWGTWSTWSRCGVTCGMGLQERRRRCDSPPPDSCGKPCPGSAVQTELHRCGPDPVDGEWSFWGSWSPCSVSCGIGIRGRSRTCSSPSPNACGCACPGPEREVDECGVPFRDGVWGTWGPWSTCPVSCGEGLVVRRRVCDIPVRRGCGIPCSGSAIETTRSRCGPNPVNGNWGPWEPWGACSVTCGCGEQLRRRRCDNPPANLCGQPCLGPLSETRICNRTVGPGGWGSWGPWSACTVTCGEGVVQRERTCDSPPPDPECGSPCTGPSTERIRTRCGPDIVDGNWGQWQPWSPCSATCDQGYRNRRRRCDSPPANICGNLCPGADAEEERCLVPPCRDPPCGDGNWGPWGAWSACPVTCGLGMVTRTRTCSNPPPDPCGRPCPGSATEAREERCGPDPVDGNWGSWAPGPCSVTCGDGFRELRRRCDRPRPNACGRPCPGNDGTTEPCRMEECDTCEWTRWSRWSSCSATCPPARRRRTRQCLTTDNQYRQDCYCPGRQDEDEECRLDPCTRWTEWGAWCPCDCRKGIRSRRRSCEIVLPPDRIGETVSVHMCRDHTRTGTRGSSEAREEEYCDVAREKSCPKCITSCYGKTDGAYPSCSSCSSYYNCTDGRGSPLFCRPGNEWDAFKSSCQPGLSPSCNPRNILRDVQGDSPIDPAAAIRNPTSDHGLASAPDTSILNETFFTDDSAVVSDQQDVKGTGEHGVLPKPSPLKGTDAAKSTRPGMGKNGISKANLPNEEAKRDGGKLEHAEETRGKNGGERENQRKDEKADTLENETQGKEPGKGKGDKHKHTKKAEKDKHRRKQVQTATCRSECWGLKPGYYPSCRGCQYYILCTKYGRKLERRCQRNGQWDDDHKKCRKRSSTCIHEADNSGK